MVLMSSTFDAVCLLQLLQSKNQKLRIVLVGEWPGHHVFSIGSVIVFHETYGNGMGANFLLSSQWTVEV